MPGGLAGANRGQAGTSSATTTMTTTSRAPRSALPG